MQREQGVRFELRLEGTPEEADARYAVTLDADAGEHRGSARIAGGGQVTLEWLDGVEPPAWCVAHLRAQLRLLYRDHARDASFPRRLARWRPAPTVAPGRNG